MVHLDKFANQYRWDHGSPNEGHGEIRRHEEVDTVLGEPYALAGLNLGHEALTSNRE